jgi:phosphatidylserine decarboxylase
MSHPILIWNRQKKCLETEQIYGESFMRWLYETRFGRVLERGFFSRRLFTNIYGSYNDSALSQHKVSRFVRDFKINMDEFEDQEFRTFNEFFIRRFRPGARRFSEQPGVMPAFAEARYFGFEHVRPDQTFPVKGADLNVDGIVGRADLAKPFVGGSLLIARLCPTDYHRFHFPDDGKIKESYRVPGVLHSVSPVALKSFGKTFLENERVVTILDTKRFGLLAYVEVGALCVGKIVQTDPARKEFRRGDEKGYFLFGGSTVILLGEPGKWKPSIDIVEQSLSGRETFVALGEPVAEI